MRKLKIITFSFSLGLLLSGHSYAGEVSALMTAVKGDLDSKYAKKYDGFQNLSDNDSKIDGLYRNNCKRLKAAHCNYMKTSYLNISIPTSRAFKIRERSQKSCEANGGAVKFSGALHGLSSTSLVRKEEPNLSSKQLEKLKLENWLVENFKVPERRDYIKSTYYTICSKGNESDVLTLVASSAKNLENDDSGASFLAKGKVFVYLTKLNNLESQIKSAGSTYQSCITKPVEAGDLIQNTKSGYTQSGELVVEVKGPVALVQGSKDAKWVKVENLEIHPSQCR